VAEKEGPVITHPPENRMIVRAFHRKGNRCVVIQLAATLLVLTVIILWLSMAAPGRAAVENAMNDSAPAAPATITGTNGDDPRPDVGSFEAGQAAFDAGDYETAVKILRPLADAGNPRAQYIIGIALLRGNGLTKDQEQATSYLTLSANQQHMEANLVLGVRYLEGKGGDQDATAAEKHLSTAAFLGSIQAQFVLGYAFSYGEYRNFRQDFQIAAEFFDLAARQQHAASQFLLSTIFFKQDEPNIFDPLRGFMWTIILINESNGRFREKSASNLELLKRQMRREEFETLYLEASLLARRCIESGYEECG
jgi:TPR repeat protein